jgi:Tfp pilus assembly protein PilE
MGKKKIKKKDTGRINKPVVVIVAVLCVALLAFVGYGAYQQEVGGKRAAQTTAGDTAGTDKQDAAGQTNPRNTNPGNNEAGAVTEAGKDAVETAAENGDKTEPGAARTPQEAAGDAAAKEDNMTNANARKPNG